MKISQVKNEDFKKSWNQGGHRYVSIAAVTYSLAWEEALLTSSL